MGVKGSKINDLNGPDKAIYKMLMRHGDELAVLRQTVNAQHAHVQILCLSVNELADTPEFLEKGNGEEFSIKQDFSRKWRRHTKELLESVQNSLMSQCIVLLKSFEQIHELALDIFKHMELDLPSSSKTHKAIGQHENKTNDDTCIEQLKDENDKLADEKQKLAYEMRLIKKQLKKCETEKASMENTVKELETEKDNLEQIVKKHEENRTVFIQILFQAKGDMMLKIIDELKSMLTKQLKVDRRKLKFVVCQNKDDVDQEIPLLVLCVNASRLGTDVGSLLHDLNVTSKVSVLVFHHKDVHALPKQASDRVLTEPEFQDLGGIFDIAFLSDKGIYDCLMNQTAASSIEQFLKSHLPQT